MGPTCGLIRKLPSTILHCRVKELSVSKTSLLSFQSQQLRFAAMRSGELLLGKMLVPRWTPQHRRTWGGGEGNKEGGGEGGRGD